jgi:hypothetical protein
MKNMHPLVFILMLFATAPGFAAELPLQRGVLVFADGNRLTGRLVADGRFASDRFGEVRFEAKDASFQVDKNLSADDTSGGLQERVEAEVRGATRPGPAAKPRWYPWKFAVSGFLDNTTEDGERHRQYYSNLRVERPHEGLNEFFFESRYEFRSKSDAIDKRRATVEADWRHDLTPRWFTLYRTYAEYDGRNLDDTQAAVYHRTRLNYLFTQQQAGLGYRFFDTPKLKSSVSASWSWFYGQVYHLDSGTSNAPSLNIKTTCSSPMVSSSGSMASSTGSAAPTN